MLTCLNFRQLGNSFSTSLETSSFQTPQGQGGGGGRNVGGGGSGEKEILEKEFEKEAKKYL